MPASFIRRSLLSGLIAVGAAAAAAEKDFFSLSLEELGSIKVPVVVGASKHEQKITEAAYDSLKNLSQKQEDALYVIIKPDPDAKFRNVIDMVDEMDISGVGKFAVQDVIKPEEMALVNVEKTKF